MLSTNETYIRIIPLSISPHLAARTKCPGPLDHRSIRIPEHESAAVHAHARAHPTGLDSNLVKSSESFDPRHHFPTVSDSTFRLRIHIFPCKNESQPGKQSSTHCPGDAGRSRCRKSFQFPTAVDSVSFPGHQWRLSWQPCFAMACELQSQKQRREPSSRRSMKCFSPPQISSANMLSSS